MIEITEYLSEEEFSMYYILRQHAIEHGSMDAIVESNKFLSLAIARHELAEAMAKVQSIEEHIYTLNI